MPGIRGPSNTSPARVHELSPLSTAWDDSQHSPFLWFSVKNHEFCHGLVNFGRGVGVGRVNQQQEAAGGHCCGQHKWSKAEDWVGCPHTRAPRSIQICVLYRERPYIVDNNVSNDVFTMGSCIWVLNVGGRHHRPVTETTMSLIKCFQAVVARGKSKGFQSKSLGGGTIY